VRRGARRGAAMAAFQRPAAPLAFSEPSGVPARKTMPDWAMEPTDDKAAGIGALRAIATRAGATTMRWAHR
jgi:hypothetical protein